jgi:hypothetical protein
MPHDRNPATEARNKIGTPHCNGRQYDDEYLKGIIGQSLPSMSVPVARRLHVRTAAFRTPLTADTVARPPPTAVPKSPRPTDQAPDRSAAARAARPAAAPPALPHTPTAWHQRHSSETSPRHRSPDTAHCRCRPQLTAHARAPGTSPDHDLIGLAARPGHPRIHGRRRSGDRVGSHVDPNRWRGAIGHDPHTQGLAPGRPEARWAAPSGACRCRSHRPGSPPSDAGRSHPVRPRRRRPAGPRTPRAALPDRRVGGRTVSRSVESAHRGAAG